MTDAPHQSAPDGPGGRSQIMTMPQWREAISKSFAPLVLSAPDEGAFRASLTTAALEDVHLFDMSTDAHRVEREPGLIRPEDVPYCKLSLQLSGRSELSQDGRSCVLEPGDMGLYVTQRPYVLEYPGPQECLVVHFPQSFVHMSPDRIARATATRISGHEGLGRVAVPLFEQLARNLDVLSGPHAVSLVRSALDMLVTVLSAEMVAGPVPENVLLGQAHAYIEDHLDDPELSPGAVARGLYVSLRQLHARFAEAGLTVAASIRRRRLDAIREDLGNPLHAEESVHAVSVRYGLLDPSYVSKAFKARFGESPSAYRARVLGA